MFISPGLRFDRAIEVARLKGAGMAAEQLGRVLIADDEALIRMGLRVILQELGYDVVGEAADGREALTKVVALDPEVVIMDIKMPGMDGLEATRQIMATHPVPIIVLTAYNERGLVDAAADAGVLAYLMKPVRESEIVPAIKVARARFADLQWLRRTSGDRGALEQGDAAPRFAAATRILSDRYQLTEAQAAARLRRLAQRSGRTLGDVAEAIIELEQE